MRPKAAVRRRRKPGDTASRMWDRWFAWRPLIELWRILRCDEGRE